MIDRIYWSAMLAILIATLIWIERGFGKQSPTEVTVKVEPQSSELVAAETEAWRALTAELRAVAEIRIATPVETREWLTLEEAAEYSGLPEATIANLLKSEDPPLAFVGRGAKSWRIQRSSLDAYDKAAKP